MPTTAIQSEVGIHIRKCINLIHLDLHCLHSLNISLKCHHLMKITYEIILALCQFTHPCLSAWGSAMIIIKALEGMCNAIHLHGKIKNVGRYLPQIRIWTRV